MKLILAILFLFTSPLLPYQVAQTAEPDPYYIVIQVFPWEGPGGPGIYATVTVATLLDEADDPFEITLSRSLAYWGTGECLGACSGARHLEYSNSIIGRLVKTPDSSLNSAEVRFYANLQPMIPSDTLLTISAQVSDYTARASFVIGTSETVTATSHDSVPQASVDATSPVPPSQPPAPADDNRMLYLEMSPRLLRMAPEGESLFHIQPVRWGAWDVQRPDIAVDINVPAGLAVTSSFFCGRGDHAPVQTPCGVEATEEPDGSTTYSITPAYSPVDQSANGIYVVMAAIPDIEVGSSVQVTVEARVDDATFFQQPPPTASIVQIVDEASLLFPPSTDQSIGVVLELNQGFTTAASECSATASDSQLGLYEIGLGQRFSVADIRPGRLGEATDGSGKEVCHVPVQFSNVPKRDVYILATSYGDDMPCRACVYGSVTPTYRAEIVFVP